MTDHAPAAARFLQDPARTTWHDEALWFVRQKRDKAAASVPEWEALRERARAIKAHTLSRLDDYLLEYESHAVAHGIHVHWAADAEAHNRIVHEILQSRGVTRLVKSKSMLTEECHLNPYLIARGIDVIDTDLGERIVQLRGEPPSHIVLPAIHLKKREIGDLFHRTLGTQAGAEDPQYLTEQARTHLRREFLQARAGLTGANFAVAATGGIVVCTNEGNADLGTSLPLLHIACVGIEKLVPRLEDLGVFTRLLARSGTGQPITVYTSHFHRPPPGGEMHVVLVDNGRSRLLGMASFREALHCIRCGACLNTCPVYRRSGGYSYGAVIPGPIGSVLGPARDAAAHASLPFASSLCGSCSDVCPVKIPLHTMLFEWRQQLAAAGQVAWAKRAALAATRFVFERPALYAAAGRLARIAMRGPRWLMGGAFNPWLRQRDLPAPPANSFRDLWREQRDR
ncbi:MAG: lactate utilization protein [Lentisphaerae bacterium]|nr:lactate utilization protein [Lentisphaerota bacterium]